MEATLSVDVKDGKVIPCGSAPETVLRIARKLGSLRGASSSTSVLSGREMGLLAVDRPSLESWRSAYDGRLLYGGGVASVADLEIIRDAGFDGAIIATALHKGAVPAEWIRGGYCC